MLCDGAVRYQMIKRWGRWGPSPVGRKSEAVGETVIDSFLVVDSNNVSPQVQVGFRVRGATLERLWFFTIIWANELYLISLTGIIWNHGKCFWGIIPKWPNISGNLFSHILPTWMANREQSAESSLGPQGRALWLLT